MGQPSDPVERKRFWAGCLIAGFSVMVVICFGPATLMWLTTGDPNPVKPVACGANLKDLAFGLVLYAADWNDRLPPDEAWMDSMRRYVEKERCFHCPEVVQRNPKGYGYGMWSVLGGVDAQALEEPSKTPMVFDSATLIRNWNPREPFPAPNRHFGRPFMVMADGRLIRPPRDYFIRTGMEALQAAESGRLLGKARGPTPAPGSNRK